MTWKYDYEKVSLIALYIILIGMFLSPVLMSSGMIILFLNFLIHPEKKSLWQIFKSTPALYLTVVYFLLYLLSGIYSENTTWLWNRLQLKLPFLVLPFGVLPLLNIKERYIFQFLAVFQIFMAAICISILIWYGLHFEAMNLGYKQGKVLPTPIEHIRFSLLAVLAIVSGIYLYVENYRMQFDWERKLYAVLSIFLFVFIHILAVRSGIVALYVTMVTIIIIYFVTAKKYLLGLGALVTILAIATLSINNIPSLKSKWQYSLWSIKEIRDSNDIARLSDSYRVASIKAGLATGMQSPIIGVGVGDVRDETATYISENYPELAHVTYTPQNQYVVTFAALGLIGVLFFLGMTLTPFFIAGCLKNLYATGFHLIAITSFLVEQTLESQVGIAFYLLFGMVSIILLKSQSENRLND